MFSAATSRHRVIAAILACLGASSLAACGSSHESFVQARAADDFECTAEAVNVDEVARSRYMARGCGKEGEYVCSATPDGVDCSQSSDLDVLSPSTVPTAAPSAT